MNLDCGQSTVCVFFFRSDDFLQTNFIDFLDSNFSHAQVSESDSSAEISNRVTVVPSNIAGARNQVPEETQSNTTETICQGSQQPTAVSENKSASENEGKEKAAPQQQNAKGLNVSDTEHAGFKSSADNVIVAKEIKEVKHVVAKEAVLVETRTENVKTSPALPEKSLVHNPNKFNTDCSGDDRGNTGLSNAVQTSSKDLKASLGSDLPPVQIPLSSDSCTEKIKNLESETIVFQILSDVLAQVSIVLKDFEEKPTTKSVLQKVEQNYDDGKHSKSEGIGKQFV